MKRVWGRRAMKQTKMGSEVNITLADIKVILKKHKQKIKWFVSLSAFLFVLYRLTWPVEYSATASFREKANSQTGMPSNTLTALLLNGGTQSINSEAISNFRSQLLLDRLVKRMDLQGSLVRKDKVVSIFGKIRDNLKTEYYALRKKQGLVFPDNHPVVTLFDIEYPGLVSIGAKIKFNPDDSFVILERDTIVGKGKIGEETFYKDAKFTVMRLSSENLVGYEYLLSLTPLLPTIQGLSHNLTVETDRDDKTLLKLKYACCDRHLAADVLNNLMLLYQEQLKREQQRILREQISYLQTRHDEMTRRLLKTMDENAESRTSEVISSGFPNAQTAMEFFASTQQQYIRNLFSIELELKRLLQAQQEGASYYDRYAYEGGVPAISNVVAQIRQLKQQADSLELAVRETAENQNNEKDKNSLYQQMEQLATIQELSKEASQLLVDASNGSEIHPQGKLAEDQRYLVKEWCEKLKDHNGSPAELKQCMESFTAYLSNLIHLFEVQEKAIQERLTHQQSPQKEFQGIDLHTAKDLYLNYSKEMNVVEAEMLQKKFIVDQMKDPEFEISSLSSVLADPVSQKMIAEASKLVLGSKDFNNRSVKEQERMREDLTIQKGFLSLHLNQTIQLLQLREKLLKDKIQALQIATLALMQQEISVLQKHLEDHVQTRVENLVQEKALIKQHQGEIQIDMAKLPKKWVSEKIVDQQVLLNERMLEELTRLVESKNTTSNLELIQSAPVDTAFAAIIPVSPKTFLFAFLGAALSFFVISGFMIVKAMINGLPVTADNLKLAGQHVCGALSALFVSSQAKPLHDEDLKTLRHAAAFLEEASKNLRQENMPPKGCVGVLLRNSCSKYSEDLATLLSKKGFKVLLVSTCFEAQDNSEKPGLLQYLEELAPMPVVAQGTDFDSIGAGGISRYGNELMGSQLFKNLIDKMIYKYDWILVDSSVAANSAEAETLLNLFDYAVVSINEDVWPDIIPSVEKAGKKLAFIMVG